MSESPRLIANYRAYVRMVDAGVPAAAIELAFDPADLEDVHEKIMKAYWAHVRGLLRAVPVFMSKLDFLSIFLDRPVEELLDAIATANFPMVTKAVAQRNHNMLRGWINELYKYSQDQLDCAQPISTQAYDAEMRVFNQ